MHKSIKIYEHQRLYIGEQGFTEQHLNALLKLNEYHDWKYFQPIANGIKFNQYVGIIQVNGLPIEIHPKADKNDTDSKWQGVLLHMLQTCGKLKAESAGAANVNRTNLNLLEVYFELYLNAIENLLRKGFIKQYRKESTNTKALKGKLEFAGHIQKNLVHKERFYTTHQVYDTNHLLHQVLHSALQIVGQFTKGTQLYDHYKRLALNFPIVSKKNITKQQLNSIVLNRKTASYSYGLELAKLIILNYSPNITGGNEKMVSLLFDMNVLWEEYVSIKLKQSANENTIVIGQDAKQFWKNRMLKPDIIIYHENKTFIIDTKWKAPKEPSLEDLRQVYTYCRLWNAEKAILLYPGSQNSNSYTPFNVIDHINGHPFKHQCKIGFATVVNEQGTINTAFGKNIWELIFNNHYD